MDNIALVVGGTKVANSVPLLYSGAQAGDSTGLSSAANGGLQGCYSRAPLAFMVAPPVAIVVAKSFTAKLMQQGYEENDDRVSLLVMVAKVDSAVDLALLNVFRDTVPAAFRAHMQIDQIAGSTPLTPEPLYCFCIGGKAGGITWNNVSYWGWSFDLQILRTPMVTYSP